MKFMRRMTSRIFIAILTITCFSIWTCPVLAGTVKIGFVTDWEYGKQRSYGHKLPRKAKEYLQKAVNHWNNVFQPDLAVGGGDYILSRGVNKKKARKQLNEINKIFKSVNAPRLYCVGNHDLNDLSEQEIMNNLEMEDVNSSTDINGVRIITIDTNGTSSGEGEYGVIGRISEEELSWLEEELNTELPIVVFSHHAPIQTPDGERWRTNLFDANIIRGVLEKNGNIIAVFSGHHAINYQTEINGINYIIINNLTDEKAKGAYADISVEKNETGNIVGVSVSQFGGKPASYNFSKTLSSD